MVHVNDLKLDASPWTPMSDPVDLKHLTKLTEELGEATAAIGRCLAQGIDEREPVTDKPNREWLEDEIADVMANFALAIQRFNLDFPRIEDRAKRKIAYLKGWHKQMVVS